MDNEMFYDRQRFKSEEELKKKFKRYVKRTNNIAREVLEYKTPNEVIEEFKIQHKIIRFNKIQSRHANA